MPCASKPVTSASIICFAASSASAGGHAAGEQRVARERDHRRDGETTVLGHACYAAAARACDREILLQPVVDHAAHAGVALREHEMIGLGEQVQIARLAGALEHLDRLLGRRHRIDRRVQQQDRAARPPCRSRRRRGSRTCSARSRR